MTRPGRFVDPCTRAYIYLSRYYLDKKDFQNVELYAKKCLGLVQTREHGNQMLKIITEMSGKFNQVSMDGLYPLVVPNENSFPIICSIPVNNCHIMSNFLRQDGNFCHFWA